MAADDLADFSAEWVEPISHRLSRLDGLRTAAQRAGHGGSGDVEYHGALCRCTNAVQLAPQELHNRIEAMKLAYADLDRYNADPRFAKVPVQGLAGSKTTHRQRATLIDPKKRTARQPAACSADDSDTTYLAAIDKEAISSR